jgi:hypothetical protein
VKFGFRAECRAGKECPQAEAGCVDFQDLRIHRKLLKLKNIARRLECSVAIYRIKKMMSIIFWAKRILIRLLTPAGCQLGGSAPKRYRKKYAEQRKATFPATC